VVARGCVRTSSSSSMTGMRPTLMKDDREPGERLRDGRGCCSMLVTQGKGRPRASRARNLGRLLAATRASGEEAEEKEERSCMTRDIGEVSDGYATEHVLHKSRNALCSAGCAR
jgi:hypothetical protein